MLVGCLLLIPTWVGLSALVNSVGETDCPPVHVASGSAMDIHLKRALIPLSNIVYGKIVCAGGAHIFSPARFPEIYCPTATERMEKFIFDLCEPLPPINETTVLWFQERGYRTHLRPPRPLSLTQNTPIRQD